MGSSGHSETEKIKILYEDSLKDIRNLTTRLEEVASKVHASSETAHEVEILAKSAISEASETFKGLADKEMKRAGKEAISALSDQVGRIAQTVAGDAAATERHTAFVKAVAFASAGVLFCAFIFGGGGFLFAKSLSSSRVNEAQKELAQANLQLENEKNRVDEKIAEIEKKSEDELSKIRASAGWLGTSDGRQVAGCKLDGWVEAIDTSTGNPFCLTRSAENPTFGKKISAVSFWMPKPKK